MLFERSGVEQDTGLLKPRYLQDGSVLINISVGSVTDDTIYTVTAGKTLYITSLTVKSNTNTSWIRLMDDTITGTLKFDAGALVAEETYTYTFSSPLFFNVDIVGNTSGSASFDVSLQGWEE